MIHIQKLEEGHYSAVGHYDRPGDPPSGLPLEAFFTFRRAPDEFEFDGFYHHHVGAPRHDFSLSFVLPPDTLGFGRFEYSDSVFRFLEGTVAWAEDAFLLAAHSADPVGSVTVYVHPQQPLGRFLIRGLVSIVNRRPVSFAALMGPHDPKLAKAQVVGLRRPRT